MGKAYRYTILTLVLTFGFALGSMMGMSYILQEREKQLLTEQGSALPKSPVRAWQESGEENGGEGGAEYTLTTEQIEEVVGCWDKGLVVHNPVSGQISMEEAITVTEEWLTQMGMKENEQDKEIYSITATLGAVAQKYEGVQLEPYYSFWLVRSSSRFMEAVLYVNAVTGKVWDAEINIYGYFQKNGLPYIKENLQRFLELAELQAVEEKKGAADDRDAWAQLQVKDSVLYAEAQLESRWLPYYEKSFEEASTEMIEDADNIFYRECTTLSYQLKIFEPKDAAAVTDVAQYSQ